MISNQPTYRPLVKKLQTTDGYYAYDARTNRLLRITRPMYEILDYFDFMSENEIINIMNNRHSHEEIKQAIGILKELSDTKRLFLAGPLERRSAVILSEAVADTIKQGAELMTLEVTDNCNLRCKYCIFSGGYPHSRTHGQRFMSFSIAKAAIDFHRSYRKNAKNLSIGFYGGEPLLNFNLVQQCVDYVREREHADHNKRPVVFSLTTNGTLLTKERIAYFIKHGFALTISLDGPRALHDENRNFANGKGTYDIVFRNLQSIYQKNPTYYKDKILINCTIPFSTNLCSLRDHFEKYPYLFGGKLNISDVSDGNDDFSKNHPPYPDRMQDLIQLEQEYCEAHCSGKALGAVFHNSFVRQLLERSYLMFHRREILDSASNSLDRVNACFPGTRKVFVDVDGRLHMCERVYRQFSIGDVWTGYNIENIKDVFNQFSTFMNSEECRTCWAVQMCPNCYTIGVDGYFPPQIKQGLCVNHRRRLETIITNYCAILENKPTAFDYMNNFLVS